VGAVLVQLLSGLLALAVLGLGARVAFRAGGCLGVSVAVFAWAASAALVWLLVAYLGRAVRLGAG
jgi:hypothetical protein